MEFEGDLIDEPPESVMTTFNKEVKAFWEKRHNSCLTWSTFILLDIANVLMVIWFIAPGWGWTREISNIDQLEGEYYGYYGLWWCCWELVDGQHDQSCQLATALKSGTLPEYWVAIQVLSVFVLVFGIAAFAVLFLYMCNISLSNNTTALIGFIALDLLAAALNVSMFVVFCVEFLHFHRWICCEYERQILEYHLWYAFGLACASHAFYVAAGIAAIFEYVDLKKEQRLRAIYEQMEARRGNQPYSFEEASLDRFRPPYSY